MKKEKIIQENYQKLNINIVMRNTSLKTTI